MEANDLDIKITHLWDQMCGACEDYLRENCSTEHELEEFYAKFLEEKDIGQLTLDAMQVAYDRIDFDD